MTDNEKPESSQDEVYFRTNHDQRGSWFNMEARRNGHIYIKFGPGSIPAVMALIDGWEHIWKTLDQEQKVIIVADMTEATQASLRVQYLIGKWLLKNKSRLRRIAVYGAGVVQVAIVQGVMSLARIKLVRFFTKKDSALQWIETED
jgi:hypothetical protein